MSDNRKTVNFSAICLNCYGGGMYGMDASSENGLNGLPNIYTSDDDKSNDEWQLVNRPVHVTADDDFIITTDADPGSPMEDSEAESDYVEVHHETRHSRASEPYHSTEKLGCQVKWNGMIAQFNRMPREGLHNQHRLDYDHDTHQRYVCLCSICRSMRKTMPKTDRFPYQTVASPEGTPTKERNHSSSEGNHIALQEFPEREHDLGTKKNERSHLTPQMKEDYEKKLIQIHNVLRTGQEQGHKTPDVLLPKTTPSQEHFGCLDREPPEELDFKFSARPENLGKEPRFYQLDPRNPFQKELSWEHCAYDVCQTHYESKYESGWFPAKPLTCDYHWDECRDDLCELHLIDKRRESYFPGETSREAIVKRLVIEDKCTNSTWQCCLNDRCRFHDNEKRFYGFGNEDAFTAQRANTSMNVV